MIIDWAPPPRCRFQARYPVGEGVHRKWRFREIVIHDWSGGGAVSMPIPPSIGDLILLWDDRGTDSQPDGGPVFRVIDRMWHHASYGSADWPGGERLPRTGPLLNIIVEPHPGLYADEAESEEE